MRFYFRRAVIRQDTQINHEGQLRRVRGEHPIGSGTFSLRRRYPGLGDATLAPQPRNKRLDRIRMGLMLPGIREPAKQIEKVSHTLS